MPATITPEQIRWFRLRRSGLARGDSAFATPEAAASALAGIQAQILPAAALALWNRSSTGAEPYDALAARLHAARSLVKLWGPRHPLHIYATEDWPMIQAAFSGRLSWWEREAARTGPPTLVEEYERAIARVAVMLQERGTMGRRDLRALEESLPPPLLSPWGGVFSALVREGHACHARWDGGEARYAHRTHWLPTLSWAPPPPGEANAALARRYFRTYGPATVQDFAYWRGISAAEARPFVQALDGTLAEVGNQEGSRLLIAGEDAPLLAEIPPPRGKWPIRLLGRFDPLLLAHRQKDWVVPQAHYSRVWRPAGHIEGIVLEHGRAVGTWRYDRLGSRGISVSAFPFRRWSNRVIKVVQREAAAVARFFGLPLAEVKVAA